MLNKIKKELYFFKHNLLWKDGLTKGEILPFEDELYERLDKVYFNGIPISIHLKYLSPIIQPGQCYDRSIYITMGFDDAILVRGNVKDLEPRYGKDDAEHGWVECNGWVYEPWSLLKFKKELYYKIYQPNNVKYYKKEEYANNDWYQDVVNTTVDDLRQNGIKRINLCTSIPLVQEIASSSNNDEFKKELNNHLDNINYNFKQIYNELNKRIGLCQKR